MTPEEIVLSERQAWKDLKEAEQAMYDTDAGQKYMRLRELWVDLYDLRSEKEKTV